MKMNEKTKYEYWCMNNDVDSIDFMIGDKVVMSEYLDKIVDEWAENNDELEEDKYNIKRKREELDNKLMEK